MTAGRKVNTTSHHWCTPQKYVKAVHDVLGIVHLDPCSNEHSIVGALNEYHLPTDGLKEDWNFPTIYVNPPYGSDRESKTSIKDWLRRCSEVSGEVIALIPVATNTSHWKEYVWKKATAVCFLYDTRLKFLVDGREDNKGAPMSCAMIYCGKQNKFFEVFSQFGAVVDLTKRMLPG